MKYALIGNWSHLIKYNVIKSYLTSYLASKKSASEWSVMDCVLFFNEEEY